MKNKILMIHPITGVITFEDVIRDLEIMLNDTIFFENLVNTILEQTEMTKEDIATFFSFSIVSRLRWVIDILKTSI